MTVKADITSTLNGQTAELLLVEDSPDGTRKQQSRSLSGGTEELVFTSLDGGRDKRYTAKVIPSTTDVTQTSEIPYGAEIRIDPIPHRDSDATQKIRDGVEFNNGISASQLGLGSSPLVSGLLTAALNDGEVLADDGSVHDSVQAAQDAASSYIFIGPGTFNESVTIDTPGLEVVGSGYNTHIDGGTTGQAMVLTANNIVVRDLSLSTPQGNGAGFSALHSDTKLSNLLIDGVTIRESDSVGIRLDMVDSIITNCKVSATDSNNISLFGERNIVTSTSMNGGSNSIAPRADSIVANNVIDSPSNIGVSMGADDTDIIVIGNIIVGAGNDGVFVGGNDTIIANNRIQDCPSAIVNGASGTVLDGNNTGASN